MAVASALNGTIGVRPAAGAARPEAATAEKSAPFGRWKSRLLRDHPLVGRIIDTAGGRRLTPDELARRAAAADVLIIGEVHDNPDHHRIQGWLLSAYAAARRARGGRRPAVIFEMITGDRAAALARLEKEGGRSAEAVFDAARWEGSGWPPRAIYRPVMTAAVRHGGPIIAGGVPRSTVREVGRRGLAVIPDARRRALALAPLSDTQQAGLEKEIVKSHCDMIPRQTARAMSGVQRLRDAVLADRVLDGLRRQGSAVLIAGDGHARADRGVPLYLRRRAPGVRVFVVWLAEAREEAAKLRDLLPDGAVPARLADVIVVTPRAEREDPCAGFARFMKKKEKKEKSRPASGSGAPMGGRAKDGG